MKTWEYVGGFYYLMKFVLLMCRYNQAYGSLIVIATLM